MKSILYLNYGYSLYRNKANAQMKAFENHGYKTFLVTTIGEGVKRELAFYEFINGEINELYKFECPLYKVSGARKFYNFVLDKIIEFVDDKKIDYYYYRRLMYAVVLHKRLIRELSERGKNIYEWPTLPLDAYESKKLNFLQNFELKYYKKHIRKYIFKETVILQDTIKMDDKMIEISNGIEIEKFKINYDKPNFNRTINMFAVAHVHSWHGYDRVIDAMAAYHGEYEFKFTLASLDTDEKKNLINKVKEYHLEDRVIFLEPLQLEDILKMINQFNIGVGSLAYHRRGAKRDTSIKNKEYCAYGLPFIISCSDCCFPDNFEFSYRVSGDDSLIDLEKIAQWYKKIYELDYKKEMHDYAKGKLVFDAFYQELFKALED